MNYQSLNPRTGQWEKHVTRDAAVSAALRRSESTPAPDRETDMNASPKWPDALAPEAFRGLAGDVVHVIEPHSEADPAALLVQFLTAFGAAAGRFAYFAVESDRHYPNLFTVIVGPTSKARKGTSWAQVRHLLNKADQEFSSMRILSGLSSGEGVIWAVRDAIYKREPVREKGRVVDYQEVEADHGVEDKRLLVIEAEFTSVLRIAGREGNSLSPTIREAWDHGDLAILTKNSPARATGAHVAIIGHTCRDELLRYFDSTEAGNGFGNRFLWICAKRSKVLPEGGSPRNEDLDALAGRLESALQFAKRPRQLCRDKDAGEIWRKVYPDLSEGRPGLLGSILGRAEAQVMRLALLYALLDESDVIRVEHLESALALWDYTEKSARFVFGDSLGYPEADAILSALRRTPGGMTRTEISGVLGRHRSEAEIDGALTCLERSALACREMVSTGGRSAERWKTTWGAKQAKEAK